jgi:hypothetical protein
MAQRLQESAQGRLRRIISHRPQTGLDQLHRIAADAASVAIRIKDWPVLQSASPSDDPRGSSL